jgi:hypothetical protein
MSAGYSAAAHRARLAVALLLEFQGLAQIDLGEPELEV